MLLRLSPALYLQASTPTFQISSTDAYTWHASINVDDMGAVHHAPMAKEKAHQGNGYSPMST
ncbi:hypothetical protein SNOG_00456 [Parastagonospora nodorum SN15]|uniref:Uncharacterized protein n=2 Tax=Phaeosphaeria nodorum (strain SN15 / ATCC MYA-4574 / FGSC 10173) TaxID=321614 RepID=A0A7U2HWS9_PHANO|nr:hypothetical protein SNOG_00456 [Parastagonospora nodorum SN15]EAT91951.2 hypothetical protein SNOG_00456 [Parastagonospora nodorum SN15]QRC90942.1 hypothetical protein JI435_004560 [Parastagonospora nodorum SN15]